MRMKYKGFTLIEFLIIIAIIVVLSTFAIPAWDRFMEINRFNNDIMAVEYTINRAKVVAMERTTNVGVCVNGNKKLILYDIGPERNNDPCTGTQLLEISLKGFFSNLKNNGIIIFDPRGLNIMVGGNICIENTQLNSYYKIIVGRGHQRVEKGEGRCP
jgi:type IV fimbrial biogenesis protein FimT